MVYKNDYSLSLPFPILPHSTININLHVLYGRPLPHMCFVRRLVNFTFHSSGSGSSSSSRNNNNSVAAVADGLPRWCRQYITHSHFRKRDERVSDNCAPSVRVEIVLNASVMIQSSDSGLVHCQLRCRLVHAEIVSRQPKSTPLSSLFIIHRAPLRANGRRCDINEVIMMTRETCVSIIS